MYNQQTFGEILIGKKKAKQMEKNKTEQKTTMNPEETETAYGT